MTYNLLKGARRLRNSEIDERILRRLARSRLTCSQLTATIGRRRDSVRSRLYRLRDEGRIAGGTRADEYLWRLPDGEQADRPKVQRRTYEFTPLRQTNLYAHRDLALLTRGR